MRIGLFAGLVSLAVGVSAASASTTVGLDFVLALDGGAVVFGDGFDAPSLQIPPWTVLSGSPLNAVASALQMSGGDAILGPVGFSGAEDGTYIAQMNLTDFGVGSAFSLTLLTAQFDDAVGVILGPDAALALDETGPLGSIPYTPGATAQILLNVTTTGDLTVTVDGVLVFAGANSFGTAAYAIIGVVPEPGTCVLLAGGAALCLLRRRR